MAQKMCNNTMLQHEKVKSILDQVLFPLYKSHVLNPNRNVTENSAEYRPDPDSSSPKSFRGFIERVLTFPAQLWGADPNAALYFAKYGWRSTTDFNIHCATCLTTIDCSYVVQKSDVWFVLAKRGHAQFCPWTFISTPDDFFKLPTNPEVTCENMIEIWKKMVTLSSNLPTFSDQLLSKMGMTKKTVELYFEMLERPVTEIGLSALVLGICGWVRGSSENSIECSFCQRCVGLWNFNSIEDKKPYVNDSLSKQSSPSSASFEENPISCDVIPSDCEVPLEANEYVSEDGSEMTDYSEDHVEEEEFEEHESVSDSDSMELSKSQVSIKEKNRLNSKDEVATSYSISRCPSAVKRIAVIQGQMHRSELSSETTFWERQNKIRLAAQIKRKLLKSTRRKFRLGVNRCPPNTGKKLINPMEMSGLETATPNRSCPKVTENVKEEVIVGQVAPQTFEVFTGNSSSAHKINVGKDDEKVISSLSKDVKEVHCLPVSDVVTGSDTVCLSVVKRAKVCEETSNSNTCNTDATVSSRKNEIGSVNCKKAESSEETVGVGDCSSTQEVESESDIGHSEMTSSVASKTAETSLNGMNGGENANNLTSAMEVNETYNVEYKKAENMPQFIECPNRIAADCQISEKDPSLDQDININNATDVVINTNHCTNDSHNSNGPAASADGSVLANAGDACVNEAQTSSAFASDSSGSEGAIGQCVSNNSNTTTEGGIVKDDRLENTESGSNTKLATTLQQDDHSPSVSGANSETKSVINPHEIENGKNVHLGESVVSIDNEAGKGVPYERNLGEVTESGHCMNPVSDCIPSVNEGQVPTFSENTSAINIEQETATDEVYKSSVGPSGKVSVADQKISKEPIASVNEKGSNSDTSTDIVMSSVTQGKEEDRILHTCTESKESKYPLQGKSGKEIDSSQIEKENYAGASKNNEVSETTGSSQEVSHDINVLEVLESPSEAGCIQISTPEENSKNVQNFTEETESVEKISEKVVGSTNTNGMDSIPHDPELTLEGTGMDVANNPGKPYEVMEVGNNPSEDGKSSIERNVIFPASDSISEEKLQNYAEGGCPASNENRKQNAREHNEKEQSLMHVSTSEEHTESNVHDITGETSTCIAVSDLSGEKVVNKSSKNSKTGNVEVTLPCRDGDKPVNNNGNLEIDSVGGYEVKVDDSKETFHENKAENIAVNVNAENLHSSKSYIDSSPKCATSDESTGDCTIKLRKRKACDDDILSDFKRYKLDTSVSKSDFHPVNEHRFWCINRLETMSNIGIPRTGWQQVLDCLEIGLSTQASAEKKSLDFKIFKRSLAEHLAHW